jgi:hypothetical protein
VLLREELCDGDEDGEFVFVDVVMVDEAFTK